MVGKHTKEYRNILSLAAGEHKKQFLLAKKANPKKHKLFYINKLYNNITCFVLISTSFIMLVQIQATIDIP